MILTLPRTFAADLDFLAFFFDGSTLKVDEGDWGSSYSSFGTSTVSSSLPDSFKVSGFISVSSDGLISISAVTASPSSICCSKKVSGSGSVSMSVISFLIVMEVVYKQKLIFKKRKHDLRRVVKWSLPQIIHYLYGISF